MNKWYLSLALVACYGDPITGYAAGAGNDAFIPENWANEGLAILEENMVMANLVSRDFEPEVRNYGDVVNTRRPGTFTITRKADGDTLVPETASATNVPVLWKSQSSSVIGEYETEASWIDHLSPW